MVQIRFLLVAKNDLKDIYDYIALDSKKYAKYQVEKIKNKTEILKSQIEIGKIVEEIGNPKIRELIEGNYRIIYRIVDKKTIHILMIHHSARDLSKRTIY